MTLYLIGLAIAAILIIIICIKEARKLSAPYYLTIEDLLLGCILVAASWNTVIYIIYREIKNYIGSEEKVLFKINPRK